MAERISPFERIKLMDSQGVEAWSGRQLSHVLGYSDWRNFRKVIDKAREACANSEHAVEDHFVEVTAMIETGKGAHRAIDDEMLSRYACYLIVQNADPSKPIVARGQTYFAVRTREAELIELEGLSEAQKRIRLRAQMAASNTELAEAASDAGVVTNRDFAIFQDHGYRGLYAGETARGIAARKGLKSHHKILDWMGSEELAANWFRATQAVAKLERDNVQGKAAANRTHFEMGQAVRRFIAEQGGTMPEDLPTPAQSVEMVRKREQKRLEQAERQPSLFGDEPTD